ncbi:MAG: carboxypeptidase regulatory-like domain-containing protein, partial [Polyangiaceae bacterium]|nr:carboxypeptidase regulatory-like domain-containing protein [Polyangiaceae bacterium]
PVPMAQVTATALDPEVSYRATEFANKYGTLVLPDARGLHLRLEASAPGSPASTKSVDTTSGRASIVIVPGASIAGEVRSDRGAPIAGANVLVIGEASFMRTRTEANGEFRFASAPSGEIRIRVEQPGFVTRETSHVVEPRARATTLPRIVLAQEAAVEGRVIDANGSPVRAAQVFAMGRETQRVTTSRDGSFRLGGLEAGGIVLAVEHPEFATKEESLSLRSREELRGITIRMGKAGAPAALLLANPGIVLQTGPDGEIIVGQIHPGSSGERAGLLPGDVLVSIDQANVTDRSSASKQLSGAVGSELTLVIERKGHQEIYKVTREPAK